MASAIDARPRARAWGAGNDSRVSGGHAPIMNAIRIQGKPLSPDLQGAEIG